MGRRKNAAYKSARMPVTRGLALRSRVPGNCAPCHAPQELPPEVAGVQGRGLRGERLTWTRKGEGTRAC